MTLNSLHFGLQITSLKISIARPAAWTTWFDAEDSTSVCVGEHSWYFTWWCGFLKRLRVFSWQVYVNEQQANEVIAGA